MFAVVARRVSELVRRLEQVAVSNRIRRDARSTAIVPAESAEDAKR